MPKFTVDFWVRHYNGSIAVDAESAEAAKAAVENLPMEQLIDGCEDCDVVVERTADAATGDEVEFEG